MYKKYFLLIIMAISFLLRFYKVGQLPNSYSPDEIAQGYTAYSILLTGKDEWGVDYPLSLRSFGDFKPPFQTYLLVPLVKLFGLNTVTIRLPSAFFGSLLPLVVFYLALEITKSKPTSYLSSLAVALSSWGIGASRIGLEANVATTLFILAIYLILRQKQNPFLGLLLLVPTVFTYHSTKVVIPIIIIYLLIAFRLNIKKSFLPFLLVILSIVFVFFFQTKEAQIRSNDLAIYHPTDGWKSVSDIQYTLTQNRANGLLTKFLFNKVIYTIDTFTRNYVQYLSPQFMLTSGPAETTYGMIPGFGILNPVLFAGLLLAIYFLIKNYDRNILNLVLFYLICILPASLAKGEYSANRVLIALPFITILSCWGLTHLKHRLAFLVLFFAFSFKFIFYYFNSGNEVLAAGMLFGHKEANEIVKKFPVGTPLVYSRQLSQPQAYYSFFQKIDPSIVQKASPSWLRYSEEGRTFLDQLGEYKLENAIFKELNRDDFKKTNILVIGRPQDFFEYKPTFIINYPGFENKPAIYVYKN